VKPKKSTFRASPQQARTLLGRVAAKTDQPGLVRVQRRFERAQSLVQIVQKGLRLVLRTLRRDTASNGLVAVRRAARQSKSVRFTALLSEGYAAALLPQ
jgi:hypothetical protein